MSILATAAQAVANVEQTLYTVPAGTEILAELTCTNRTSGTVKFSVATLPVGMANTGSNTPWIEFEAEIVSRTPLIRSGLLLSAGEKIVVKCDNTAVNYVLIGKADPVA